MKPPIEAYTPRAGIWPDDEIYQVIHGHLDALPKRLNLGSGAVALASFKFAHVITRLIETRTRLPSAGTKEIQRASKRVLKRKTLAGLRAGAAADADLLQQMPFFDLDREEWELRADLEQIAYRMEASPGRLPDIVADNACYRLVQICAAITGATPHGRMPGLDKAAKELDGHFFDSKAVLAERQRLTRAIALWRQNQRVRGWASNHYDARKFA